MRQLMVLSNGWPAGLLTERFPGKSYVFEYDKGYLYSGMNPVSVTLPLREDSYESEKLFPFFANMIPEGANRKMICRARRIDENDLFGILEAMADSDTIGSVTVRSIDE